MSTFFRTRQTSEKSLIVLESKINSLEKENIINTADRQKWAEML